MRKSHAPFSPSSKAIGRHPPSPNWHRRQRAARAKLRRTIRLRREAGLPLREKDVLGLQQHHSRPIYKIGMGGKRQQQQWKDSREQYWRGSWAVSPRAQRNQQPRYDQVQLGERTTHGGWEHPWNTGPDEWSRAPTLAQAEQKELTSARKADTRLRKLAAEKELRTKQWEKFKADQKRNFVLQKQQFGEDMARLDMEIQQASESGSAAADRMKQIVLHGAAHGGAPQAPPVPDDQEWESLMMAEGMAVEPSSFLREALHAAQYAGQPMGAQGMPGPPMAPPPAERLPAFGASGPSPAPGPAGHVTPAPAAVPGHVAPGQAGTVASPASLSSEPLLTDPYTGASPARMAAGPEPMMSGDRRTSPIHPGQRVPGTPRVPTSEEPPRAGIKPATSAPHQVAHSAQPGATLADKLEAKRSVLEPFGKARFPAPPGLSASGPTEAEIAIAEARAMALNPPDPTAPPGLHPALAGANIVSDDEGDGDELT